MPNTTQPDNTELKCGHTGPDWNDEGDCITCARNKVLGGNTLDERLDDIVSCVYSSGKMSEWKLSETNSSEILRWMDKEQAKQALTSLFLELARGAKPNEKEINTDIAGWGSDKNNELASAYNLGVDQYETNLKQIINGSNK